MSTYASDLCVLLVDNLYGELTSRIFKVLLRDGRLSILALSKATGLTSRLIKHGLSVLVQQQLVFWYTSAEDATIYEANTAVAYNLVRAGKYAEIAEEQLGHFAGVIISNLLLLGHARVGDLVHAYGLDCKKGAKDVAANASTFTTKSALNEPVKIEHPSDTDHISLESVHLTLCKLLRVGFISLVHESFFRSEADNRTEAGKIVPPPEYFKAKTKRDSEAQRETAIQEKLEEWRYGTKADKEQYSPIMTGNKRRCGDSGSSLAEKRRRLHLPSHGQALGTSGSPYTPEFEGTGILNNDLVLCINHDKFAVVLRNRSLIALAGEVICTVTSEIYREILRRLEADVRDCKEEPEVPDFGDGPGLSALPYVSTDDILYAIRDSADLAHALGKVDPSSVNLAREEHPKKRRKKTRIDSEDESMADDAASPDGDEDESDSEDSDGSSDFHQANGEAEYNPSQPPKTPEGSHRHIIREHLLLLAQHPYQFLYHFPETPILPERWAVHYPPLIANITHHALLQTITTRYGQPAGRLTRLLSEKGKVDEKNLCSLSLLNQKSMRSYLTTLHKSGMIQLQEIPRDNSRNPQRTLFLWFFDVERCKAKVLQESYKTMARCLQRVRVEGDRVKTTVEKANRSDVIGREEQFLGLQEREALKKWRQVEEKIWGEIGRLDEMVGILRDF